MKFIYTVETKPDKATNGATRTGKVIIDTKDPSKHVFLDYLSHGLICNLDSLLYALSCFCRYENSVIEDYEYDKFGISSEIVHAHLNVIDDDHDEFLEISVYSTDRGHILFSINDNSIIKCRFDGYTVLDNANDSVKVNIGVLISKKCPNIANYVGYHLVLFDAVNTMISGSDELFDKMNDIMNDDFVINMTMNQKTTIAALGSAYTKWADVIMFTARAHDDSGKWSFKCLVDEIIDDMANLSAKYPNLHKIFVLNSIRDEEFSIPYMSEAMMDYIKSNRINPELKSSLENSEEMTSILERIYELVDTSDDEDDEDDEEPSYIGIPVDLTDPNDVEKSKKELKGYIEDYVNSIGIPSTNVDGIVDMILSSFKERKERSETGGDPGVYIGGISISYNPETGTFDNLSSIKGIDITKDEILSILADDFKDDAIVELVQRLRDEGRITDDISNTNAIAIIKSIIDEETDDDEDEDGGNE